LVVAAHPDDEALGCAGTIARHISRGDSVDILFVADGVTSRRASSRSKPGRKQAALRCARILGARKPLFLDFPDNRLDTVALLKIVRAIETVARAVAPEIVYTHHRGDLNVDHRITHDAVMTAFRPVPQASIRSILGFEVPSSTEWTPSSAATAFLPTMFVDIAPFQEVKRAALGAYTAEMRPFPHPRSVEAVEALGRWRGATCGVSLAEAFEVLRLIVD
jgi:LmbE family N-acetylglucosaminyl deacetylase